MDLTRKSLRAILVGAIAIGCAATVAFALTIASPASAYAQGRALVCVQQSLARGAVPSAQDDGLSWESLMEVSPTALASSGLVDTVEAASLARSFSLPRNATISLVTSEVLTSDELVALLQERDDVLFAELDRAYTPVELWGEEYADETVPTTASARAAGTSLEADIVDPLLSYSHLQWFFGNGIGYAGSDGSMGINLPANTQRGRGTVVAVLDTGVDDTHENLADKMVNLHDTDLQKNTGCGDHGYNATVATGDHSDISDNGSHGTHVAGIVAASGSIGNSPGGTQGVACAAELVAVRVLDDRGYILTSSIVRGLSWLVEAKNANVDISAVNVSVGGDFATQVESLCQHALEDAGIVVVYASGNDSTDIDVNVSTGTIGNATTTLIVDSMQADGNVAPYTNYGKRTTDLFAPGSSVLSSVPSTAAQFTAFTAAENARRVVTGHGEASSLASAAASSTTLVYEGCETDSLSNSDSDVSGGLEFSEVSLDESGNPAQTYEQGAKVPTTDAQWFLGNRSIEVKQNGAARVALLSETIDLTKAGGYDAARRLYAGLSSYASKGINYTCFQYRLKTTDGSVAYSARPATLDTSNCLSKADYIQWRASELAAKQVLPDDVDCEHFQILVTVDFDASTTDASVFLDCIGVGYGLEKYAVYGGTSMAAPMVTGAIGVLAAAYPSESVYQRAARIKGGVTVAERFSELCETGGYLDLAKAIENPNPVIDQLSVTGCTATLSGWFFEQGDVMLVNGVEAATRSWTTDSEGRTVAVVELPDEATDGVNEFKVVSADGRVGRAILDVGALDRSSGYVDLPIPSSSAGATVSVEEMEFESPRLAASNEGVYLMAEPSLDYYRKHLWRYDETAQTWSDLGTVPIKDLINTKIIGAFPRQANFVGEDSLLYATLEVSASDALDKKVHSWLLTYDCTTKKWSVSADVGDALAQSRLIVWKDRLCVIGGARGENAIPVDTVSVLDPVTCEQTVIGHLPVALEEAQAVASGDDLVVMGGFLPSGEASSDVWVTDLTTSSKYAFLEDYDKSLAVGGYLGSADVGAALVGLAKLADGVQSDTTLFDKVTGAWIWTGKLCSSLPLFDAATVRKGDTLYVFGQSGTATHTYLFRSTDMSAPAPSPDPTPAPNPVSGDGEAGGDIAALPTVLASTNDGLLAITVEVFLGALGAAAVAVVAIRRSRTYR